MGKKQYVSPIISYVGPDLGNNILEAATPAVVAAAVVSSTTASVTERLLK
jgi:hypothetical protein